MLMLRPSAAVSDTAPVVESNVAVTPVWLVFALTAAATCAPRSATPPAAASAPISTPLILISPAAIAVPDVVTVVPATFVALTVAVTPVWLLAALIAAAFAIALPLEAA